MFSCRLGLAMTHKVTTFNYIALRLLKINLLQNPLNFFQMKLSPLTCYLFVACIYTITLHATTLILVWMKRSQRSVIWSNPDVFKNYRIFISFLLLLHQLHTKLSKKYVNHCVLSNNKYFEPFIFFSLPLLLQILFSWRPPAREILTNTYIHIKKPARLKPFIRLINYLVRLFCKDFFYIIVYNLIFFCCLQYAPPACNNRTFEA